MRGLPLLILLGMCASAWSATVYKWVDDNGVVHYSDQPNPKAEKLQISGAQTYGARAAAVTPPAVVAPAPTAVPAVCVIDTPGAGQVYLDTFAITGHVTLAHAGGDDSQVSLHLDGQDISGLLGPDGSFSITQIDRGEHSLTLQVSDARGNVTCQANAVRFSVRQRSASVPGVPTVPGAPAAPKAPGVGVVH